MSVTKVVSRSNHHAADQIDSLRLCRVGRRSGSLAPTAARTERPGRPYLQTMIGRALDAVSLRSNSPESSSAPEFTIATLVVLPGPLPRGSMFLAGCVLIAMTADSTRGMSEHAEESLQRIHIRAACRTRDSLSAGTSIVQHTRGKKRRCDQSRKRGPSRGAEGSDGRFHSVRSPTVAPWTRLTSAQCH